MALTQIVGPSLGNVTTSGVSTLTGAAALSNTLAVTGATTLSSTLAVTGAATLSNTLAVTGIVTGGTYNGQTINATASLTGTLAVTGAATLSNTLAVTGAVTGGTYNGQTINATASFTGTVGITGVATFTAAPIFSSATASQAVFTDGSKALVSNAITGTGNVVMSASPTLTGTIGAAAMTLSGTLDVTGVVTGGTYNGQTISSAASLTGTLGVAGLLTVSGFGTHTFGAGGTGSNSIQLNLNGGSATNNGAFIAFLKNSDIKGYIGTDSALAGGTTDAIALKSNNADGLNLSAYHASGAIRFYSGGTTERMRIATDGNVGIGTTAPTDLLDLRFSGTTVGNMFVFGNITDGRKAIFGTGADYAYWTGNAGDATLGITVKTNGNVGIGTTAPLANLQVGNQTFSGGNGVYSNARLGAMVNGALTSIVYASTYNDPTYPDYGLVFIHGATTASYNVWSISPDGPAKGDGLSFIYAADATNIHVGTPKVYFDGNGNVGIGTTAPLAKLQVGSFTMAGGDIPTAGPATMTLNVNSAGATTAGDQGYQMTLLESSALGANKGGALGFQAVYDGSNNITTVAGIKGLRENATASNHTGYLSFLTRGAAGAPAERVRITSAGNVGIGTSSPDHKLDVHGDISSADIVRIKTTVNSTSKSYIVFHNASGAYAGYIYQSASTSVGFVQSSDLRLKENIVPTAVGLSTLMQINIRDFNFIADTNKIKTQGFIAQELYPLYPAAVAVGDDDEIKPWGVDYGRLTPLIIKSVQELNQRTNSLTTQNAALEARIATLEAQLAQ